MARKHVCRDPIQPGDEWRALPLETPYRCQRLVKNFCRQVLRFLARGNTPGKERIDPLEIHVVQLGKPGRLALCRFNQQPLVWFTCKGLHCLLRGPSFCLVNGPRGTKSYVVARFFWDAKSSGEKLKVGRKVGKGFRGSRRTPGSQKR